MKRLGLLFTVMMAMGVFRPLPAIPARADSSRERAYQIASTLPLGVRTFLSLETNSNTFNVDYHYGHVNPAADGAYPSNVGSSTTAWAIEGQRYGDVDVIAGVLHHDLNLVRTGLKMFDFGLYREAPNGSFPGSAGLFHGTTMFLAQAGPAMLVLKYWAREPYLGAATVSHINWEISRMKAAATYMVQSWWGHPGHIDDGGKEERKFEAALALESVGVLSHDTELQQKASVYARAGIRMTEPDGVWTEHGLSALCCHDSGYQAIGLIYGIRYLALLGSGPLCNSVWTTVQMGESWELSRTTPGGAVNRTGDDRTGPTCPEVSGSGKCKSIDLDAVYGALMRWSVFANKSTFIRRAYFVWLHNWQQVTGQTLPAPSLFVYPHSELTTKELGYGWTFGVGGTRFQPLEPVVVYFAGTKVGQTVTDQEGSFGGHSPVNGVRFQPPQATTPGSYTVTAVGGFGTIRKTSVTITG